MHVSAGQAPWQNAITERHGGILKSMLKKCVAESILSFEQILPICVQCKDEMRMHRNHLAASDASRHRGADRSFDFHVRWPMTKSSTLIRSTAKCLLKAGTRRCARGPTLFLQEAQTCGVPEGGWRAE